MRLDSTKRQKLEQVAALALHPNTGRGEWEASAVAFFRILRNAKVSAAELLAPSVPAPIPENPFYAPRYSTFQFGKYKGVPFTEVPLSYLAWALKNVKDLPIASRAQIREILAGCDLF
jgi:hypothetical protein